MATEREIDILAREVLHLMEIEGVPEKMAKQSVLNAHKDIEWTDGIMKDIGVRIWEIKKSRETQETAKPSRNFTTLAEKTAKD